jgi:hypothetical protein
MATIDYNEPETPIADGEPLQQLPDAVRFWFSVAAIVVLIVCAVLMGAYIRDPKNFAAPSELQLGTLLLASFMTLLVTLVPWHKLGLRIRKVGAVEFERVVSTQAAAYAEDFAEMRVRIDELERQLRGVDDISTISESFATPTLRPLVIKFLTDYQPTAYSVLRMREWGGRQPGFEKFKDYDLGMIRHVLQSLVAEGAVATRVSRLGNTLYKFAD